MIFEEFHYCLLISKYIQWVNVNQDTFWRHIISILTIEKISKNYNFEDFFYQLSADQLPTIIHYFGSELRGGLFLENIRRVINFWVLLHFYALISKLFQISVGLRMTRLQHLSLRSVPPVLPQNNVCQRLCLLMMPKKQPFSLKSLKNIFGKNIFICLCNGLNIFVMIEEIRMHCLLKSRGKSK